MENIEDTKIITRQLSFPTIFNRTVSIDKLSGIEPDYQQISKKTICIEINYDSLFRPIHIEANRYKYIENSVPVDRSDLIPIYFNILYNQQWIVEIYFDIRESDEELKIVLSELLKGCVVDSGSPLAIYREDCNYCINRQGFSKNLANYPIYLFNKDIDVVEYMDLKWEFGPEYYYPVICDSIENDLIPIMYKRLNHLIKFAHLIIERNLAQTIIAYDVKK